MLIISHILCHFTFRMNDYFIYEKDSINAYGSIANENVCTRIYSGNVHNNPQKGWV